MPCKIANLTYRTVSIRGNSGETWHLPPRDSLDLIDAEVTDNAKIAKLVANGAIAVQWEEDVQPEEHAEPVAGAPERGRRSRAQQAGNA